MATYNQKGTSTSEEGTENNLRNAKLRKEYRCKNYSKRDFPASSQHL